MPKQDKTEQRTMNLLWRVRDLERQVKNLEKIVFQMIDCDNCKHNAEDWQSDACVSCCKAHSNWERSE